MAVLQQISITKFKALVRSVGDGGNYGLHYDRLANQRTSIPGKKFLFRAKGQTSRGGESIQRKGSQPEEPYES